MMEINIEDYLSKEEIKAIVESEVRSCVDKMLGKSRDVEVIMSNTAYRIVWNIVNEWFADHDIQFEEMIKDRVISIISNLSQFSVFYDKDYSHDKKSPAQMMLEKTIEEEMPRIKEKVKDIIANYDYEIINDSMADFCNNMFAEMVYIGAKKLRGE